MHRSYLIVKRRLLRPSSSHRSCRPRIRYVTVRFRRATQGSRWRRGGIPGDLGIRGPHGTCQRPGSRSLLRGQGLKGVVPSRANRACREGTCGPSPVAPRTSRCPLLSPAQPDRSFPRPSLAAVEYAARAHASRPGAGALIRCPGQPVVAQRPAGPGHAAAAQKNGTVLSTSLTGRLEASEAIRRPYPPSCPAQRSGARGPALSGRAAACPTRALCKH
jgi:hypothetical protein